MGGVAPCSIAERDQPAACQAGSEPVSRRCSDTTPILVRVLRVHVHRVLQGENGLGAFDCRIDAADAGRGAPALATATVTVFQPDNVNQFLEDGKAG